MKTLENKALMTIYRKDLTLPAPARTPIPKDPINNKPAKILML